MGLDAGAFQHSELTLAGVYMQDQIAISRYIDLIGGIRFDHFDIDFTCLTDTTPNPAPRCGTGLPAPNDNALTTAFDRVDNVWSPRAGVVFKPIDPLSLYVSYAKIVSAFLGRSVRQPLGWRRTGTVDPRPEEFINHEIGFKWEVAPNLFFTGALFQLDRMNQLVAISARSPFKLARRAPKAANWRLPDISRISGKSSQDMGIRWRSRRGH